MTWLVLSALWAAGGLIAWLAILFSAPDLVPASRLALQAVVIAGIGLALRLPILTGSPHTSHLSDHVVLLLGYAAAVNWLGCLLLRAPSFVEAIPALLILALAETWIHCHFYFEDSLSWLRFRQSRHAPIEQLEALQARSVAIEVGSQGAAGKEVHETKIAATDSTGLRDHRSNDDGGCILRKSYEGVDEEGRRYLSGEIQVQLVPEQQVDELLVGFCPAFEGEPDVDFEVNDERLSAKLLNCNPAGMRLAVRRINGSSDLADSLNFELQWYAVQVSPNPEPASVPVHDRVLP